MAHAAEEQAAGILRACSGAAGAGCLRAPSVPTAAARRPTTRLVYAPGKIVPIPASIPHEEGDMVDQPDRPRPALDRRPLPDLRHRRLLRARCPTANTSAATSCHVSGSDHYNGLAVDIVPLNGERQLRRHLERDHPPRPLGRAGPERAAASLPLGRLRRRRRPRLRQPPPPLLEPRARGPVPTRRMGRSLPRRPRHRSPQAAAQIAAAETPDRSPRRHRHHPLRWRLAPRRLAAFPCVGLVTGRLLLV